MNANLVGGFADTPKRRIVWPRFDRTLTDGSFPFSTIVDENVADDRRRIHMLSKPIVNHDGK